MWKHCVCVSSTTVLFPSLSLLEVGGFILGRFELAAGIYDLLFSSVVGCFEATIRRCDYRSWISARLVALTLRGH